MDIRQLRYFVAIAEEKQITAAAKKLCMAQPPLSQQLKNMEEEMSVSLVDRNGKTLKLTEAGQALYQHALKIIKQFEEAQQEISFIGLGLKGNLNVGVNTLSFSYLPHLLQEFQMKYPNVRQKIVQNDSRQLENLLHERVIELAIVRFPIKLDHYSVVPLLTEPFVFVTSEEMKGLTKTISFKDIASFPLILPSTEGLGIYQLIYEEFTRNHLEPNIICECSDIGITLELVAAKMGATIIPKSIMQMYQHHHVYIYEIDNTTLNSSTAIIWLKHHYLSKAAQNFIEMSQHKV